MTMTGVDRARARTRRRSSPAPCSPSPPPSSPAAWSRTATQPASATGRPPRRRGPRRRATSCDDLLAVVRRPRRSTRSALRLGLRRRSYDGRRRWRGALARGRAGAAPTTQSPDHAVDQQRDRHQRAGGRGRRARRGEDDGDAAGAGRGRQPHDRRRHRRACRGGSASLALTGSRDPRAAPVGRPGRRRSAADVVDRRGRGHADPAASPHPGASTSTSPTRRTRTWSTPRVRRRSLVTRARRHGDVVRLVLDGGLPAARLRAARARRSATRQAARAQPRGRARLDRRRLAAHVRRRRRRAGSVVDCADVAVPRRRRGLGTLTVVGFDPADPDAVDARRRCDRRRRRRTVSDRPLYVATAAMLRGWWGRPDDRLLDRAPEWPSGVDGRTRLYAFDLDGDSADVRRGRRGRRDVARPLVDGRARRRRCASPSARASRPATQRGRHAARGRRRRSSRSAGSTGSASASRSSRCAGSTTSPSW